MTAEAGPSRAAVLPASQSPDSTPISFRELHDHLELSTHRLSPELLARALRDRTVQLKACGHPFARPARSDGTVSSSSTELTLWNGRSAEVKAQVTLLINDFSNLHTIDPGEAASLVWLYLESEAPLEELLKLHSTGYDTPQPHQTGWRRRKRHKDDLRQNLLSGLTSFYFEERLAILRIIPTLLRIMDDPSHDLHQEISDIAQGLASPKLALHILDTFDELAQLPLPHAVRADRGEAAYWVEQRLRQQLGLLEALFFLYYLQLSPTAAMVVRILDTVRTSAAGRRMVGLEYLDEQATHIHAAVSHLLILVAVESLNLESHMNGEVSLEEIGAVETDRGTDWLDERALLASPQDVHKAIDVLELLAEEACCSPLLLAWALLVQKVEAKFEHWFHVRPHDRLPPHLQRLQDELAPPDTGDTSLWERLAGVALSPASRLFDEMHSIATSSLITSTTTRRISSPLSSPASSNLAHRAVFKGLLLSITELVRAPFIADLDQLIGLWEVTFGSGMYAEQSTEAMPGVASLCDQFWSEDLRYENKRALLELAVRRWPVSFRPLLRLSKALTGACAIQAIPNLDASAREVSERCSLAVYRFLAQLPSVAQALPRLGVSAPYELVGTSAPDAATYRTTRLLPFFGWRSIRPNAAGTVVSDTAADVLVVWESSEPVSGWLILADCLASFAGLLATPVGASDYARKPPGPQDVFTTDEDSPVLDLEALAPGEDGASRADCVADILDLFAAVCAGGAAAREELLLHLDKQSSDDGLACNPRAPHIDLVQVTLRIADQALAQQPITSRVATSALKLLTLLVPSRAADIFVALRSSNVLTGSPGLLPTQHQSGNVTGLNTLGVPPSRLLQDESVRGHYSALLTLFDLHMGLLLELQRSQFNSTPELIQIKSEVLLRAAGWMIESVWVEYQSLPFASARDQVEVGHRIATFLHTALGDVGTSPLTIGNCPASALCRALERVLVLGTNRAPVAPIAAILGGGDQLLQGLYASQQYHEAQVALQLVEATLQLTHLIVHRKRQIQTYGKADVYGAQSSSLGTTESLFYEHAPSSWRRRPDRNAKASADLAAAVLGYTVLADVPSLSIKAARLIIALCGSSKDMMSARHSREAHQHVPSLAAHFGSPKEIDAALQSLRSVIAYEAADTELRAAVWTMLATFVDSQPALAQLVLQGYALDTETRSANDTFAAGSSVAQGEKRPKDVLAPQPNSILLVAQRSLTSKAVSFETQPALLESILRFTHVAWLHAMEHPRLFEDLRSHTAFWSAITAIGSRHDVEAPPLPETCSVDGGYFHTEADDDVSSFGHQQMCIARALSLLCEDIQLSVPLALYFKRSAEPESSPSSASQDALLQLLDETQGLADLLLNAVDVRCDTSEHSLMARDHLHDSLPAVNLSALRLPARLDDFDEARKFGDNYVYDAQGLCTKLQSVAPLEKAVVEDDSVTSDGLPDGWQMDAFLAVARVNTDWAIIDAQIAVLQAWTTLLRSTLGYFGSKIIKSGRGRETQQNVLSAWLGCARVTVEEVRDASALQGIHSHRTALLAVLLQVAWGLDAREPGRQLRSAPVGSPADVVMASQLACRLLTHEVFRVDDSVAGLYATPFHQDVYTVVLVCTVQFRRVLRDQATVAHDTKRASLRRSRGKSAAFDEIDEHDAPRLLHTHLHRVVDIFATHCIFGLRLAADRAIALHPIQSSSMLDSVETDATLLTSALSLLLRNDFCLEPHFWSTQFQATGLLTSCCDLLRRALWRTNREEEKHARRQTGGEDPELRFMPAVLHLFATLAASVEGAELLALGNVMTALSSNALTETLERGELHPLSFAHTHSHSHRVWVQTLRLVSALARSLAGAPTDQVSWADASVHFVENDVEAFVRIYGRQLLSALAFTPLKMRSGFGPVQSASHDARALSIPLLEEVEATVQLFYVITSAHEARRCRSRGVPSDVAGSTRLAAVLADATAKLLQQVIYLLQHPKETLSLVQGGLVADVSADEIASASAKPHETDSVELSKQLSVLLESIATSAVAALVLWSRATATIVSPQPLLLPETSIIAINSRTAPTAPTSLGSLLDLASFLTDQLRSCKRSELDRAAHLSTALEQTLALATAQLIEAYQREAMRGSSQKDAALVSVKRDVTLSRSVQSAIETSRSVLSDKRPGESKTEFVDLLKLGLQRVS